MRSWKKMIIVFCIAFCFLITPAFAADSRELPYDEKGVDLMQRISEYDSFTDEEKLYILEYLGVYAPPTEEELAYQPPMPEDVNHPLAALWGVLENNTIFGECIEEEKEILVAYFEFLSLEEIEALSEDGADLEYLINIHNIFAIYDALSGNRFSLEEALGIMELYSDSDERNTEVLRFARLAQSNDDVAVLQAAKEMFLNGERVSEIREELESTSSSRARSSGEEENGPSRSPSSGGITVTITYYQSSSSSGPWNYTTYDSFTVSSSGEADNYYNNYHNVVNGPYHYYNSYPFYESASHFNEQYYYGTHVPWTSYCSYSSPAPPTYPYTNSVGVKFNLDRVDTIHHWTYEGMLNNDPNTWYQHSLWEAVYGGQVWDYIIVSTYYTRTTVDIDYPHECDHNIGPSYTNHSQGHEEYWKCSCGDVYWTNNYVPLTTCDDCYIPLPLGSFKSGYLASGNKDWYKFKPSQSGYYEFYTTGSTDTYGELYLNPSSQPFIQNDDSGEGLNFSIIYNLTAGTTYYLKVRGANSATGGYLVWVRPVYDVTIENYYDNAFNTRYASAGSITTNIQNVSKDVNDLFLHGFGLRITNNTPTSYMSRADFCKTLPFVSPSIDSRCPGGVLHICTAPAVNEHQGVLSFSPSKLRECTSWCESYYHFIGDHPGKLHPSTGEFLKISILWTGNKLFDVNSSGVVAEANRSFKWYDYGINLQEVNFTPNDYYSSITPILVHELSHVLDAIDHYHEQTDINDISTCLRMKQNGGDGYCSFSGCNTANKTISRPTSCVMNDSRMPGITSKITNDVWCPYCRDDIKNWINGNQQ